MNFYSSENLLFLWVLPFVGVVLYYAHLRVGRLLNFFAGLRVFDLVGKERRLLRVFGKNLFLILTLGSVIFALARPRWGYHWRELPVGGSDVLVLLDLSSSMLAEDISPNRLERAKREITDLISMLEGDRIGIIPFAGVSYVACPLTSDYRLATLFLKQLSFDNIPVQGTDIFGAVKRAADSLEKSSKNGTEGKSIILMTDGEESEDTLTELIPYLKQRGIKVYSIGIGGEEGAPIPEKGGGFKKDEAGKVILSKLDEAYLKRLSEETGGLYVRSTSGDMDLDYIYRKGIQGDSQEEEGAVHKQKIWYERYQWFLILALLFYLPTFFISDYGKRRSKELV